MNKQTKGISLMLLSTFLFAIMGAAVKSIPNIPISEKIFFRNLVGFIVIGGLLLKDGELNVDNLKGNLKILTLRSIFGVLGVAANFYAISKLPLANASLLNRLSPFFVILFSYLFLKEKVTKNQILAMLIAITGAIFVIKPSLDYRIIPSLVGFTSAALAGGGYVCVRQLRLHYSPRMIVFYFSTFSMICALPDLLMGNVVVPNIYQLSILLLVGVFATMAQMTMTKAYKYVEASKLAIYGYANIIFATILGIFIWRELPDMLSMLGGLFIIGAGIINYVSINKVDD